MAKQVRETTAGAQISAWVILNKKGKHVATVNAHYGNSRVSVDVWNLGDDSVKRCFNAALKCGALSQKVVDKAIAESESKRDWATGQHADYAAYDLFGLQQGSAGGYGYDKFAAALSGLWIDGQQMANHCGTVANAEAARVRLLKDYQRDRKKPFTEQSTREYWNLQAKKIGAHFNNWRDDSGWTSIYFETGLSRLDTLGYQVIQAI